MQSAWHMWWWEGGKEMSGIWDFWLKIWGGGLVYPTPQLCGSGCPIYSRMDGCWCLGDESQKLVFGGPSLLKNPTTTHGSCAQTSLQGGEVKLAPRVTQAHQQNGSVAVIELSCVFETVTQESLLFLLVFPVSRLFSFTSLLCWFPLLLQGSAQMSPPSQDLPLPGHLN